MQGRSGLVQFMPSSILRYDKTGIRTVRIDLSTWPDAWPLRQIILRIQALSSTGRFQRQRNYKAILRYNPAAAYAKVVGELSVLFGYPLSKEDAEPPPQLPVGSQPTN